MNAATEQIDRQADERCRRAETRNSNEERTDSSVHNEARGAQIVQNNTLSTPVAVVAIIAFFVSGLLAGLSIMATNNARDVAAQARMEARLAQEDLIMLRAAVRARGITVETAADHD